MKCIDCKKIIPSTSKNCPYCGSDLINKGSGTVLEDTYKGSGLEDLKTNVEIKKPINKKGLAIMVLVSFFALGFMAVLIFFTFFNNTQKNLFAKTYEEIYTFLYDTYLEQNTDSGKFNLNFKINNAKNMYRGTYSYDIKNKIINIDGTRKDPNEATGELILDLDEFGFKIYLKNNELYFKSNQIIDNFILLPIENDGNFLATKNYDVINMVNAFSESFLATLNKLSYKTKTESINHRGKQMSLNKMYYTLDNAGKKQLITTLFTELSENANFVNEIARVQEKKADEIIEILKNYITTAEYRYSKEKSSNDEIAIYYDKSYNVYRLEFNISKKKVILDIGDKKYYVDVYENNKNLISLTLSFNRKEVVDSVIDFYDITFDTDKYVTDINLKLEHDETPKVKREDVENSVNIQSLTEQNYVTIKTMLSRFIKDDAFLDKVIERFKSKCSPNLTCNCEEGSYECSCLYEGELINCPIEKVKK